MTDTGDTGKTDGATSELEPSKGIKRMCLFVAVILALIAATFFTPVGNYLNKDHIESVATSLGFWGPLAIALFGIVTPLFFMPRWPVAVVAGLLYGVAVGTLLANACSLLGALLQFSLARNLLAPMTHRVLDKFKLKLVPADHHKVLLGLFLIRAFPLSNFSVTNLLAGAMRIKTRIFFVASFFGMLPSTLMYASWGKVLKNPSPGHWALAIGVLLAIIIGTYAARRHFGEWFRQFRRSDEDAPEQDGANQGG